MTEIDTFYARIYVALGEGYTNFLRSQKEAEDIIQEFMNKVKLCVTVTPTKFVYVDRFDPGIIVGLINYPRFPSNPEDIKEKALDLAELLRAGLGQNRVSVQFPDKTVMLP